MKKEKDEEEEKKGKEEEVSAGGGRAGVCFSLPNSEMGGSGRTSWGREEEEEQRK